MYDQMEQDLIDLLQEMSSVLFWVLIFNRTKCRRGRLSTLTSPKRARVLKKKGPVPVLDLERLSQVKGVFKKPVKRKQKSMSMDSRKVAGIATCTRQVRQSN